MSVNKVILLGNVGKIDTRYTTGGDPITSFSLALNESYKSKTGEKVEKTEWVNCVAYKKLADIMREWVKVGSQIYVEGKIQTRKWQDKEGKDKYTTEVIVSDMKMLGKSEQSKEHEKPSQQMPAGFDDSDLDKDIPFN
jgi:single-strand DNA-binding protein